MDNYRRNYFDSFHKTQQGEVRNQYYDPFYVKHRKRTTKAQLKVLEKTFEACPRPDSVIRKKLGDQLGMTPRSVQVWFQNRRAKLKKVQSQNSESDTSPAFYCNENSYIKKSMEDFDLYPTNNSIMTRIPQSRYSNGLYNSYPPSYFHRDIENIEYAEEDSQVDQHNKYNEERFYVEYPHHWERGMYQ